MGQPTLQSTCHGLFPAIYPRSVTNNLLFLFYFHIMYLQVKWSVDGMGSFDRCWENVPVAAFLCGKRQRPKSQSTTKHRRFRTMPPASSRTDTLLHLTHLYPADLIGYDTCTQRRKVRYKRPRTRRATLIDLSLSLSLSLAMGAKGSFEIFHSSACSWQCCQIGCS